MWASHTTGNAVIKCDIIGAVINQDITSDIIMLSSNVTLLFFLLNVTLKCCHEI